MMNVAFSGFMLLTLNTINVYPVSGQTCPPLVRGPYVEFPLACGVNIGDRCNVGCERGFELIGSCYRVCCSDGQWTGYPASCINRNIQCPVLVPPVGGRIVDDCLNFAGFTCRFECNPGITLVGSPTTDCLVSGMWSSPPPTCGSGMPSGPTCFDLNPPANGLARGSCVSATAGMVCSFACDIGFLLVGSPMVTCTPPGWTAPAPVCQPILCPNLTAPANGVLTGQCAPGRGGGVCQLLCNSGYRPSSPQTNLTCQGNMMWDFPLPTCEPITCPALPTTIPNGQSRGNCAPGIALSFCEYQCSPGYAVSGSSSLLCQLNGNWAGTIPICTPILCPRIIPASPNDILSGQCDPGYANMNCTVTCPLGFQPTQPQVFTCQQNGMFNGQPIPCAAIPCPPLIKPENGIFLTDDPQNRFLSSCNPGFAGLDCIVQCNPGYLTIDREPIKTINCNINGMWTSPVPECLRVTCRPIQSPMNGKASEGCLTALSLEQCVITCDQNYQIAGPNPLICQQTGAWSAEPPPTCVRKRCNVPEATPAIPNGQQTGQGCTIGTQMGLAGTVCVYSCNAGFALLGSPVIDCVDPAPGQPGDGEYRPTGPLARCVQILCNDLPVPENGAFVGSCGNVPGSQCRVMCDEGYRPVPPAGIILCQDTGQWTQPVVCEAIPPVECRPNYNAIENGAVDGACAPGIAGMVCTFTCNSGFQLFGADMLTCQGNGQWDAEPPVCRQLFCPALQAPANGFLSGQCGFASTGGMCTFTCNMGYTVTGSPTLTCQGDGMWSSEPPTCTPVTCPSLTPPEDGYMQGACQPGRFGDVCTFFCLPGFRLVGMTNLLCLGVGNWNGVVPTCEPIPTVTQPGQVTTPTTPSGGCYPRRRCCPRLYPPRFVLVWAPYGGSCSNEVGSRCVAKCNSGYESAALKSGMQITCMRNRRWNVNVNSMKCTRRNEANALRPWFNIKTNETRMIG
ncbi:Sushi, von Willebrand factor type A, EGF and pentraxin domain-containing protein 1 [Halotydeus destructor]|nr:Sushi, von Willebrand factor type A, EGF and pentraxin domain-containing protein 1 [Halotydeus destructor]